jgi:hypothetical protein
MDKARHKGYEPHSGGTGWGGGEETVDARARGVRD